MLHVYFLSMVSTEFHTSSKGGRKKVCGGGGGGLESLSETPPPRRLVGSVTGSTPKPPNHPPTVVVLMCGHLGPHPMAQRKMDDVVPYPCLPLAQTTRMHQRIVVHNQHPSTKLAGGGGGGTSRHSMRSMANPNIYVPGDSTP